MNLESLIEKYTEQTIIHLEESWNGNSTISNKARRKRMKYFEQIKNIDKTLDEFLILLNHENEYVQLGASFHLLKQHEKQAVNKLLMLKDSNIGGVAFNAKMVLDQWQKGHLK